MNSERMLVCPQRVALQGPSPPRGEAAVWYLSQLLHPPGSAARPRRACAISLSQVVLESGRVQLLVLAAQGLCCMAGPLKAMNCFRPTAQGTEQRSAGESWAGDGSVQENPRHLPASGPTHPQQRPEQLRPGPS